MNDKITYKHYKCCCCNGTYSVPWKGIGNRQEEEFYQQNIYFFLPFYIWRLCPACAKKKATNNPFLFQAGKVIRMTLSLLSVIFAIFLFLIIIISVGVSYIEGKNG